MASTPINENGQINATPEEEAPVVGMYKDYFLDYASYVILERAVPMIEDGLKPVQRRILHAMREMHDGRYHKVANIIGQTMQYHPHGDASIGDALVKLGQKELMVDCQGNWGDNRTGDSAAAPRYIEARLSKFALHVAYNPAITAWQASYDGRNKEPLSLPMKFPMVLSSGIEGIAVGLSTRIMPHNFIELCKASIRLLEDKSTNLVPDFPNGGQIDVSNYQGGKRGGKVRCRATIEVADKTTLLVKDVPYGSTTTHMIESIVKANDRNKIKIKKVIDNTAKHVEIQIDLPSGISPDVTIDALYAFTDCEVSLSPNACVIIDDKPVFLTVDELLKISTDHSKHLLKRELEVRLAALMERQLFSSLEKIFIENRIYHDIEECETWEAVLDTIDKGLEPYKPDFYRVITQEDIVRLTEIKIKRISKFDTFKADEAMRKLEEEIAEIKHNLAHLVEYAVAYFEDLIKKFGAGRERTSEIRNFDDIKVRQVAIANQKLYADLKEGFVGFGLKKGEHVEYIKDCSDLDDVIVFRKDGKYMVNKVQDKAFMGKNIIHVDVWRKGQERKVYHAVYRDPVTGRNYAKRFSVTAITRDREYDVTNGNNGAKLLYFEAHQNSESELLHVKLSQGCRAKKKVFDFDFGELAIKGRSSQGNVLTKYPIQSIKQKSVGSSTLGGRKIWYDETVGRLNVQDRGQFLGEFDTEDRILVLFRNGSYELTDFELTNRYDFSKIKEIVKVTDDLVISAVHYDGERKDYFVKRFKIETTSLHEKAIFISEAPGSKPILISTQEKSYLRFTETRGKTKQKDEVTIELSEFIDVKGWKALGNKLSRYPITRLKEVEAKKVDADDLNIGDTVELDV